MSLPDWLQQSLPKLRKVCLRGISGSLFASDLVLGGDLPLVELDLSWNKQLVSLPAQLQQGLRKLQKLSLTACDSLDFGALSTFLNGSGVTEVDLSSCESLKTSPTVVSAFIKNTKTIEKLRFEESFYYHSKFLHKLSPYSLSGILFGPSEMLTISVEVYPRPLLSSIS